MIRMTVKVCPHNNDVASQVGSALSSSNKYGAELDKKMIKVGIDVGVSGQGRNFTCHSSRIR